MSEQITILIQRLPESPYWDVHTPGKPLTSSFSLSVASEEAIRFVQQLGGTALIVVDDQSLMARKARQVQH